MNIMKIICFLYIKDHDNLLAVIDMRNNNLVKSNLRKLLEKYKEDHINYRTWLSGTVRLVGEIIKYIKINKRC